MKEINKLLIFGLKEKINKRWDWQDIFTNIANIPQESFEKVKIRIMIVFNSQFLTLKKKLYDLTSLVQIKSLG